MGYLTDSMFNMFALVMVVYIVGICIYLGFQQIRKLFNKRQERRNNNG